MADERIHHHHHHHHHHKKKSNILRIAVVTAFIVVAIPSLILIHIMDSKTVDSDKTSKVEAEEAKTISYDGKIYEPRDDIETYLIMGIDVDGKVKVNDSPAGAGQADFILLIVLDNTNKCYKTLQINRDSLTDVSVLGLLGDKVGTKYEQICLAHAYGNGEKSSCENVVDTVSNLLSGINIDGYVSLNVDGIGVINDALGGVTVTIEDDFSGVDPTLVQGETINLIGQQAENFVRSRSGMDDATNLAREKRQRAYLDGLRVKASGLDNKQLIEIFDQAEDYIVTDMGSKTQSDVLEKISTYSYGGTETIDGESKIIEGVNAYELDEDSLGKTTVDLFFKPQEA